MINQYVMLISAKILKMYFCLSLVLCIHKILVSFFVQCLGDSLLYFPAQVLFLSALREITPRYHFHFSGDNDAMKQLSSGPETMTLQGSLYFKGKKLHSIRC